MDVVRAAYTSLTDTILGRPHQTRPHQVSVEDVKSGTAEITVEDGALEYIRFLFDQDGQDVHVQHDAPLPMSLDLDADSTNQQESPHAYESQPSFASQIVNLVKEHSEAMGDSDESRQIQYVVSEILYSRPKSVTLLTIPEIKRHRPVEWRYWWVFVWWTLVSYILTSRSPLYFVEGCICLVLCFLLYEGIFRSINNVHDFQRKGSIKSLWRSFSSSESLPPKRVTMAWICICQDLRTVQVPKSFAKGLVEIIKQAGPGSPIKTSTSAAPPTSSSHQKDLQARSTYNLPWQSFPQQAPVPAAQSPTAPPPAIPIPMAYRYVMFMVETDRLRLVAIESHLLSNEQLFDRMRLEYRQLKGWFRAWFGLSVFSHCDFYKFEAWTRDRYCERERGIPPASEGGHFYLPRPMDNEPPISKHEFYDRFYQRITPEQLRAAHGSLYHDHDAVDRIPQKKGLNDIAANGRPQFWGIIAREKKSGTRILIYIFLSSLPGIIFFFLWLFVLDKDSLQDASTLLMISLTLLSILYAAQLL